MIKNIQMVVMLVVVAVIAYLLYQVFEFFKNNKEKFNPVSDKNLAYQGANAVVQAVTGDDNATVGTWLYDWFNPPKPLPYDATQAQKTRAAIAANKASKSANTNPFIVFGTSEGE